MRLFSGSTRREPSRTSTGRCTRPQSRRARRRSPSSTRWGSRPRKRSRTSWVQPSSTSTASPSTSTGTTTSASPRRRPSRPCARAPPGSTARSTAWASAPATPTSARSPLRCARSTGWRPDSASTGSARQPRACRSCPATGSRRGSRSRARLSSAANRARSPRSSTTHRPSSRIPRSLSAPSGRSCSARRAGSTRSGSRSRRSASTCPRSVGPSCSRGATGSERASAGSSPSTSCGSSRVAEYDAVVVGSGVNSLACAALLARADWRVCVLERNDWFGGAVKTEELTEPGFLHDVFSAWHPLWVGGAAHAELGDELAARGLEYLNTEHPTATLFPDGEAAFLLRDADANAAELDRQAAGDGDAWRRLLAEFFPNADLSFGVLGTELWSREGLGLGAKALRRLGRRGLVDFAGDVLVSSRDWLTQTFASELAHGLLAPWVLHTGLGPDSAASGFMTQVIAVAIQEGGMPIPRGGGAMLVDALAALIRDHGGTLETGRDVERIVVRDGTATGVQLAGGETRTAERAVIANVTPTQLYGRLLELDGEVADRGRRFRYGRSEMQIHFALSEPPRWHGDERLGETAIVHLTPGLDGVSRAVNEAERGLLPAEATVVVGQPLTMDRSRAPDGAGLLWTQLQELPWQIKGDAAGDLEHGDGTWTENLR